MGSRIIGKKFNCISRAIDMLCLLLGEDYTFIDAGGERYKVADYAIHYQTQWRFREGNNILLASSDVYEPNSEDVSADWRYDLIGRPDELSSIFDVQAKSLMKKMCGTIVTDCRLSAVNDMIIVFSNDVVFEQFMSSSQNDEEWRLIDYKKGEHIVCYGADIVTE